MSEEKDASVQAHTSDDLWHPWVIYNTSRKKHHVALKSILHLDYMLRDLLVFHGSGKRQGTRLERSFSTLIITGV